jgi:hypothetical protein
MSSGTLSRLANYLAGGTKKTTALFYSQQSQQRGGMINKLIDYL